MPEALPEATISLPNLSQFGNIGELASAVITVLLTLISVLALGALIYGGYQYITSSGNPESAQKAKSTITWGIIGLIVAFAAYIIVDFVIGRLTG
jgi:TRAP-type C4-dicarboxylate transport system permease small subunit